MNPGGKGANQAVAAARLGGDVKFICKTGNDVFGKQAANGFKQEGIDTSSLLSDPNLPSGVALITVDDEGENTIVVASGANAALEIDDLISKESLIAGASLLLMQLEIPLRSVEYAASVANKHNVPVILNPAPATSLPTSLLALVDVITPNENEASMLTGVAVRDINTAKDAARQLSAIGNIKTVIVTLGNDGALVLHNDIFTHVPVQKVKAVDTTAAGDIFNGALSVAIAEGKDIITATHFACTAAAISVTRMGAQASAPYKHEIADAVLTSSNN